MFDTVMWGGLSYFMALPFFCAAAVCAFFNHRMIVKAGRFLVHALHQKRLFSGFSITRQRCKFFVLLLFLLVLFVGLMRPQWGKCEQIVIQEGRDLIIALDISKSMRVTDFKPNRLDFSKLKIKALLSKLECERVGLILFSGSAFIQCPLTRDYNAFIQFLDQVDVELIASGTTATDRALVKAVEMFGDVDGRENKLVILMSDGEDFSTDFGWAQQRAKEANLRVITYGVGSTEGAPIPHFNQFGQPAGHEHEDDGKIALSRLDSKKLESIAKQFAGKYVKSTYDDGDIDKIVDFVSSFEREKYQDQQTVSLFEERYPWFVGAAAVLYALEWLL